MPSRYANGHISKTVDPIHFMFGSREGFSGSAEWIGLSSVLRPRQHSIGYMERYI